MKPLRARGRAESGCRHVNRWLLQEESVPARQAGQTWHASPTGGEVKSSQLSGTRNLADVLFSYTNRNTDFTDKFFVRVDVTEEFPFRVTKVGSVLRPMIPVELRGDGMGTGRFPGFTAESTIHKGRTIYRFSVATPHLGHSSMVAPAAQRSSGDLKWIDCNDFPDNNYCRECGNSGPDAAVCCPDDYCVVIDKRRIVAGWGWGGGIGLGIRTRG